MKAKKKDIFRNVIKQAEMDEPPADFTDVVMNEVMRDAQHEIVINAPLRTLLQQNAVESPSTDFTANVMARLDLSRQVTDYKPVITKKAGYIIAGAIMSIVLFLFLKGTSNSMPRSITHVDNLSNILNYVITISPVCLITLVAVSALLLVDYFINNQLLIRTKKLSE